MSITSLLLVAVFLNIVPGPAMFFVAEQSLKHGLLSACVVVCGIELGTAAYCLASVCGLTAIIAKSASLSLMLQCGAAVFLIYFGCLGMHSMTHSSYALVDDYKAVPKSYTSLCYQGLLINLFNPKILVFFLVLLPQYIDFQAPHFYMRLLMCGGVFGLIGLVVNLIIAFTSKWMQHSLSRKGIYEQKLSAWASWVTNAIFIVFGLSTIFWRILDY